MENTGDFYSLNVGSIPARGAKMLDIVVLLIYTFITVPVAQRLERGTHNSGVGGSNPSGDTIRRIQCKNY